MPALSLAIVGPDRVWSAWSGDPLIVAPMLAVAWAYFAGVGRLWRQAGRGEVVRVWQARAFAGGLIAVALALLSPLEALSGALLSAHMAQHLVLVLVAAPLVALGGPLLPMLWGLPERLRASAARHRPSARTRRRLRGRGALAAACLTHVAALWIWHLPPLYQAALRSDLAHAVEHAAMFGTALAVWLGITSTGGPIRRADPAGALAMFAIATLTVGLAALITFAREPLYPAYAHGAALWGIDPLSDQQVAGAMMWMVGGLVYTATGAGLFAAWLFAAERREQTSAAAPPA